MRKLVSTSLLIFLVSLFLSPRVQAEIPVKAKAFLTVAAYGAAGGALLGAASLAFGGSTRAIAQGASLGLYAGLLFGTYVLVSHHNKRYGNYDDNNSPYHESRDVYGDDYDSSQGGSSDSGKTRGGFFDRFESVNQKLYYKRGGVVPPLYMNLFNLSF
jgi:hypothetical protein